MAYRLSSVYFSIWFGVARNNTVWLARSQPGITYGCCKRRLDLIPAYRNGCRIILDCTGRVEIDYEKDKTGLQP